MNNQAFDEDDVEKAKRILYSLFNHLKNLDKIKTYMIRLIHRKIDT